MAASSERNLKLKITGDFSEVASKVRAFKKDIVDVGATLSKQTLAIAEDGKKLTATFVVAAKKVKDLKTLQDSDGGAITQNFEAEETALKRAQEKQTAILKREQAARKTALKQQQNEKTAIFRRGSAEKLRLVRLEAKATALETVKGADARVSILARNAARVAKIETDLAKKLAVLSRQAGKATKTTRKVTGKRTQLLNSYRKEITAINQINAGLDRTKAKTRKTVDFHKNWIRHVTEIVGIYRLVNFGINTVIQSIKAIPKIGIEFQTTKAILESTLGSSAAATAAFQALNVEAERSGKNILSVRENFRNLSASMTLAGETTKTVFNVFRDLNTISTALHQTEAKTEGVFLAIAQIFNKTKVQSEELVKQLGNLLPGAFASFAKSMGITTRELTKQLQAGLVTSDRVAKFASEMSKDFSAAFVIADKGIQANTERMKTSFVTLGETIFLSLEEPMQGVLKTLTSLGKTMTEVAKGTTLFNRILEASLIPSIWLAVSALGVWKLGAIQTTLSMNVLTLSTKAGAIVMLGLKAAMAFLINPVTIVAGIVAIAFALDKIKNKGKAAADEAINFFNEVERKASERAADPIEFDFKVAVEDDATVKKFIANLGAVEFSLKRQQKRLEGLQEIRKNLFSLLPDTARAVALSFSPLGAQSTKEITEVKKEIASLQKGTVLGEKQIAQARKNAIITIEAQIFKEKELQKSRQESLNSIKEEAKLKAQTKVDAHIKAELAYQKVLANTRIAILTAQGKLREAAQARLQLQTQENLAQLSGSGAVTQSLQTQLLAVQNIKAAEIDRSFDLKEKNHLLKINSDIRKESNANHLANLAKISSHEAILNAKRKANIITEIEAFNRLKQAQSDRLEASKKQLAANEELVRTDPSKELLKTIQELREQIGLLTIQLGDMTDKPKEEILIFGEDVRTNLEGAFADSFVSFVDGSKNATEAMRDFATGLLKQIARIAAQKLAEEIIGLAFSAFGSGTSINLTGAVPSAKGNVFDSSGVVPFAKGGVVTSPTVFPFANGIGLMGEAGAEAILPLHRDSSGELGVKAAGSNGNGSSIIIQQLIVNVEQNGDETAQEQSEAIAKSMKAQLKTLIVSEIVNAKRSGNTLNPTQLQGVF